MTGKAAQISSLPQVASLQNKLKTNPTLTKEFFSNIDALNRNMKPVKVINAVIDWAKSTVSVYQDGSFTVAHLEASRINSSDQNNGSTTSTDLALSSSQGTVSPLDTGQGHPSFWSENFNGLGY